ncbi:hypothetical protein ACFL0Q_02260 [Thermodesulfobacteriota bacterium]
MPTLIPVQYHKRSYPEHIHPKISEIAGHFDIPAINPPGEYCLHTEYSFGKRRFDSPLIKKLPAIANAHRNGVPRLWDDGSWAIEFSEFISLLCESHPPTAIEIHPPFSDYCPEFDTFLNRYRVFEERILSRWPSTEILLENRGGTTYRGGKFLVSKVADLVALSEGLNKKGLSLKIAIDLPQLLSAYGGPDRLDDTDIASIILGLSPIRHRILGLHLWGKRKNPKGRFVSHVGDLNSYFDSDREKKQAFLDATARLLDDEIPRHFVPEVNSNSEDLVSIVSDLEGAGFEFQ